MSNEIKRMKYFNGLLLKEEDLRLEQEYHMKLQRLHNRFFHDWGVVDGLAVNPVVGSPKVTVSQGLALNRIKNEETNEMFSQEIWICDSHPDNPVDLSGYDVDKDIYITLSYEEAFVDKDSKKGGDNEIHIWERSRISHSDIPPKDPSKDIILARVRLGAGNSGAKVIAEISEKNIEGTTQIRKNAVTQGTSQEFAKIYVGEKDKLNLPSIGGLIDKSLGEYDGLSINSPYTKFSGKVISGELKTHGNLNVNGNLTVNANNSEAFRIDSNGAVNVEKTATVKGNLTAAGGLKVTGESTTLNTPTVEMSGNKLTINKYTPKKDETGPRMQSSGVEVYRGEKIPNAMLVWDETKEKWKAGTEVNEFDANSGMYDLAYGPDWDTLHGGTNADNLHKHSTISDTDGKAALTADRNGNVNIKNKVIVSGGIVAKGGLEVPSGDTDAKLVWNEADKHWQIGIGTDMYNIPYGKSWQDLTTGLNADILHNHSEIYNSDRDIVMAATPTGDVKVYSDLSVAQNLIVEGELIANKKTEFKEVQQVVTDSVIVVNKPSNGEPSTFEGGLEVYRGEDKQNARLIWDEGSDSWKIGIGSNLSAIPSGIKLEYLTHGENADQLHTHGSLVDEEGSAVVDVDYDGNVNIASDVAVIGDISVESNASIKGDVSMEGSVVIKGDLQVDGIKKVKNVETIQVDQNTIIVNRYSGTSTPLSNEGGLEVYRGGGDKTNAKIIWNDTAGKWMIGTGGDMRELPYGDNWETLTENSSADSLHKHSTLNDVKGSPVISVNSGGEISLSKNTKVTGNLAVDGPVTISGDLEILGQLNSVENVTKKIVDEVEDSTLLLNKFEGDKPPLNESGIEVYRGKNENNAKIIWDHNAGIWKMGVGQELTEIPSGNSWKKLTDHKNADSLHSHGQIYNEKGDILALSTRVSGNIDIAHDLTVGQDMSVLGNLEVKGDLTRFDSKNIEVVGNSITMNRFDSGELKEVDTGITIYRGVDKNSAILAWDEVNDNWKIGMTNSQNMLKINQDGSLQTPAATVEGTLTAGSAYIKSSLVVKDGIEIDRGAEPKPVIKWLKDTDQWVIGMGQESFISTDSTGKVGIGTQTPGAKLDVNGNAVVSGNMSIKGNSSVTGALTAGSAEINGVLKVNGGFSLNKGIEVDRGSEYDPAKIVWNEEKQKWLFGIGENLSEVLLNDLHKHTKLYSENESTVSVLSDIYGNVGIGALEPKAKLDVAGDTIINGKITIKDTVEVSGGANFGGKISAREGFEVTRKGEDPAKLYWNEDHDTWQAGFGDELKNISLADHTHNSLYSGDTKIVYVDGTGNVAVGKSAASAKLDVDGGIKAASISVTGTISADGTLKADQADIMGSIKAASALITKNLTVDGDLTVNGDIVKINTTTLDVEDNIITLNKYAPQPKAAEKNAGIEVFRGGGDDSNALLIWNESNDAWQAGTIDELKTLCFSDHKHNELTALTGAMTVSEGKIGIGTATPAEKLDVEGNAHISNRLTATEAAITGTISTDKLSTSKLSTAEATITGTLGADSINTVNANVTGILNIGQGIELTRVGNEKKAQIKWNETNKTWQAGIDGTLKDISLNGHNHTEITNITGTMTVKSGNVGINNTFPQKKLDVVGDTGINGKLSVTAVDVDGTLNANNVTSDTVITGAMTADTLISDSITTGNLTLNDGISASGSTVGKLSWNAGEQVWLAGASGGQQPIALEGHRHTKLHTSGGTETVTVYATGNVGIGTTAEPAEGVKLEVNGEVRASNITASGVAQTSSREYKENIEELQLKTALDLLKKLNPVTFDYKNNYVKRHNIGFIAEEVPEIFTTSDSKAISIMDIVAVLTAVVKKQQTETAAMKKQLNTLQKQVAELIGA